MNLKTVAVINILVVLIMWFAAIVFFIGGIFAGLEKGDGSVNTFAIMFSLFILISSVGLLLKKNWARIGTIIISLFFVYDAIFQTAGDYGYGWRFAIPIIGLLVFVYLLLPSVKSLISNPIRKNTAPLSISTKILLATLGIIFALYLLLGNINTA
jgi:hypothetical protein